MKTINPIESLDLRGRRVFVRVDFNVPLSGKADGSGFTVADDARIRGALPTIQRVIEQGGKCILASHLGRPDGKVVKKYSLEPVGSRLSELLGKDVILTEDCMGDGPRGLVQQMRPGEVLLLENLRFHPGEEENSVEFANRLFELCEVYISDAFGTLHRAHASTAALPKLLPERDRGMGYLVQKELENLEPLKEAPLRPFTLVTGGSKVSDKIGMLEQFLPKVDNIVIGGAMAYAFLKAQGHQIGKSLCDDRQVTIAAKLIKGADVRGVKLYLPKDHLIAKSIDADTAQTTVGIDIPDGWMGVDIGPKTIPFYGEALASAEMIFWNGPMGVFEKPAFAQGTFEMARMIGDSNAKKLAGGGDSAAAISKAGVESRFDFISTGGGATLEYLEGKELPGLKALELSIRSS
jgi:phosphoglycerate kinase